MKTYVLNGVNLGRLGTRQTDIYGLTSYEKLAAACVEWGKEFVIPSGEVRPGVRSPEVWAFSEKL